MFYYQHIRISVFLLPNTLIRVLFTRQLKVLMCPWLVTLSSQSDCSDPTEVIDASIMPKRADFLIGLLAVFYAVTDPTLLIPGM